MNAIAVRARIHELVDQLDEPQAERVPRLLRTDPELAPGGTAEDGPPLRTLSIIGIGSGGPVDLAERSEDYLREQFEA